MFVDCKLQHIFNGYRSLKSKLLSSVYVATCDEEINSYVKSINGKSINSIYEYMDRLNELKPGMKIPVKIERNGKIIILLVAL